MNQDTLNVIVDQALKVIDKTPGLRHKMVQEIRFDIVDKMYSNSKIPEIPGYEIFRLADKVKTKQLKKSDEEFELFIKLYLLGKMDGVRSERAKKKSGTN